MEIDAPHPDRRSLQQDPNIVARCHIEFISFQLVSPIKKTASVPEAVFFYRYRLGLLTKLRC